jgi:cardiolipin synthase A/B
MLASWFYIAAVLNVVLVIVVSGHAVLSKRDTRAAIGWVGVIWLAPFLGVLLYVWLGINRIKRRARLLRADRPRPGSSSRLGECSAEVPDQASTLAGTPLQPLVKLVRDVTRRPLLEGNRVTPLVNGDRAYPAMLQAIDGATRSITLTTYIFDHDSTGQRFLEALRRAVSRHVEVRVLIDYVGARYSWRPIARWLRRAGVPCAQFLPTLIPWRFQYSNLRSHRKILVVDGRIGFTGGINIHAGNCLERQPRHPVQDLHFCLTGPVVAQLQAVFADDWPSAPANFCKASRGSRSSSRRARSWPAASPMDQTMILRPCASRSSARSPARDLPCGSSRPISCPMRR